MNARTWIGVGALLGAIGVSAGALGAHGLRQAILPDGGLDEASPEVQATYQKRIDNYGVAVRYQMYHVPALILVGLLLQREPSRAMQAAGWLFLTGTLLFSGFLYAWVLTQITWLVHIVPIGGTAFILGWIALAIAVLRPGAAQ